MALPVAVELALLARFYERFGDHCVNLADARSVATAATSEVRAALRRSGRR